jgi:hypothetical protein
MKMWKKWKALMVGLALAVVGLTADRAYAGNGVQLNIDVTIVNSLSVAISTAQTSTMTYQWDSANREKVAATTSTVTNDSGGLTEKWNLKTIAQAIMSGGSVAWDLQASTKAADVGAEQFSVMAQMLPDGTVGCPAFGDASWLANGAPNLLNTAAQIYGAAFAGGNAYQGTGGAPDVPASQNMWAGSRRALCWKVIGPTTSANTTGTENIQIIITAQ